MLIPSLHLLFRYAVRERVGTIILSVLVGHTAWHWMIERGQVLSAYSLPDLTNANLASVLRWLMAAVILSGLLWLATMARDRLSERRRTGIEASPEPVGRPSQRAGLFSTDLADSTDGTDRTDRTDRRFANRQTGEIEQAREGGP